MKNSLFILSQRSYFHMIMSYAYADITFCKWDIATKVIELVC